MGRIGFFIYGYYTHSAGWYSTAGTAGGQSQDDFHLAIHRRISVFTQPDFTYWYTETPKRAENTGFYFLRIRVIGSSPRLPHECEARTGKSVYAFPGLSRYGFPFFKEELPFGGNKPRERRLEVASSRAGERPANFHS
jgi:hypothetical protein